LPANPIRDGVFGAIHINGPASAEYDVDLGPLLLSDWTHPTAASLLEQASLKDGYPMDNGLINGTNVFGGKGKRFEMNMETGTAYRLRLINTAMDTHYKVALDGHMMKVISADFVSIKPFDTEVLNIGIGQRYDVIINATKTTGNYWFRANAQAKCGQHAKVFDVKAIVRYQPNSTDEPTSKGPDFGTDCTDMPMEKLIPSLPLKAGPEEINQSIDFGQNHSPNGAIFWEIKGNPYHSPWNYPSKSL
jgi:FtsP/CotA-like multicopper oxidase with cupredoxin domain